MLEGGKRDVCYALHGQHWLSMSGCAALAGMPAYFRVLVLSCTCSRRDHVHAHLAISRASSADSLHAPCPMPHVACRMLVRVSSPTFSCVYIAKPCMWMPTRICHI